MPDFQDFSKDDEERCYCRNCISGELAVEADEYFWRLQHPEDVECDLEDSLLEFASSERSCASQILLGYYAAYHNILDGKWSPVH